MFTQQNIFLLIFEEYILDIQRTLERIASFLGISPRGFAGIDTTALNTSVGPQHLKRFPSGSQPEFCRSLKQFLRRILEDDVYYIAGLLGRRLNAWRIYTNQSMTHIRQTGPAPALYAG